MGPHSGWPSGEPARWRGAGLFLALLAGGAALIAIRGSEGLRRALSHLGSYPSVTLAPAWWGAVVPGVASVLLAVTAIGLARGRTWSWWLAATLAAFGLLIGAVALIAGILAEDSGWAAVGKAVALLVGGLLLVPAGLLAAALARGRPAAPAGRDARVVVLVAVIAALTVAIGAALGARDDAGAAQRSRVDMPAGSALQAPGSTSSMRMRLLMRPFDSYPVTLIPPTSRVLAT
jgi:hypothetical protein